MKVQGHLHIMLNGSFSEWHNTKRKTSFLLEHPNWYRKELLVETRESFFPMNNFLSFHLRYCFHPASASVSVS